LKYRVLIIEDNEQNLYLLTFLLTMNGYAVDSANEGPSGIEKAKARVPDLILLDIQLPIMDGYAVAQAIRREPLLAAVPIVAVTSYAMPGDKEKAMASGCTGYIEKPINPETFLSEIRIYFPSTETGK